MAKFVIRNGFVSIGGTDVSDKIQQVTVEMTYDAVEVTAMGAGAHQTLAGLRADKFTLNAFSDFDSSTGLDKVVWPIFTAAATTTVICAPAGGTVSATNPFYSGTVSLLTYNPINGAVGDASQTPLEFVTVGATITRATS